MTAIPVAIFLGGPISTTLLVQLDGLLGLAGWRWLFLCEAAPAIILGFLMLALRGAMRQSGTPKAAEMKPPEMNANERELTKEEGKPEDAKPNDANSDGANPDDAKSTP